MRAATFRNETTITRIPTFYPCLPAFHAIKSPQKEKGNSFHERTDPRTYLLRILEPPFLDDIDTIPCHSVKLRILVDFSVGDHPTMDHPPIPTPWLVNVAISIVSLIYGRSSQLSPIIIRNFICFIGRNCEKSMIAWKITKFGRSNLIEQINTLRIIMNSSENKCND